MSKLVPTAAFNRRIAELIAEDTAYPSLNADPCEVRLLTGDFTPSPTLRYEDLGFATFEGGENLSIGSGSQTVVRDHEDTRWGVSRAPMASLSWVCTEAPEEPVVVTGYAIIADADLIVMSARFAEPVTIRKVGDYVEVPQIFGFLPPQPFLATD